MVTGKSAIKFNQIRLKFGGRASLIGMTGTGKSTLARELIKPFSNAHVFDEKGNLFTLDKWSELGFSLANSIDEYKQLANEQIEKNGKIFFKYPKLIYVPAIFELENIDIYNDFFQFVYLRENTLCYVDEVYSIIPRGRSIPSYFKAILTRGRQKGITGLFAMQRPFDIPKVVLTETEKKYIFRLQDFDDRKRVYQYSGFSVETIGNLPDYHFLFSDLKGNIDKPLKLNLGAQ